ncbi:transcriptional regulator, ModE family [Methylocella silvestris BL2]|uniref:Transcriptional regulator, ModE family n=1 Tax=Methylocella silvestris (strain DSM 15510 / CIP 108128 / LMG 27833 / NCIMB 13906 / BL2) TaxID=395965 RepID=B8ENZ8_METSB|nr:TOBE domain-containing protein [Methylocella silvestris]ACK49236.1 transcriptional regulator, ModE family [Methylocella silvestris BL2]
MPVEQLDALLSLRSDGRTLVGRDRIALLEAVIEHGSMTQAAKVAGFSYKAAWDAVQAINNLLPQPAFVTRAGGRRGRAAEVTEEGRKLISAFRRLEEKLLRISNAIAAEGLDNFDDLLLWGLSVKISARNAFRCKVVRIDLDPVDANVTLQVSEANNISAIITRGAAETLRLAPGRSAVALVKSSFVMLAPPGETAIAAGRNRLEGRVARRINGVANSEIELDIGDGKILIAVAPRVSSDDLAITEGDRLEAIFNASHVILATD